MGAMSAVYAVLGALCLVLIELDAPKELFLLLSVFTIVPFVAAFPVLNKGVRLRFREFAHGYTTNKYLRRDLPLIHYRTKRLVKRP